MCVCVCVCVCVLCLPSLSPSLCRRGAGGWLFGLFCVWVAKLVPFCFLPLPVFFGPFRASADIWLEASLDFVLLLYMVSETPLLELDDCV